MPSEVYLDNAATSFPKPESVYLAADRFLRHIGTSPARGSYPKAQESQRILIQLRSKLSQLLGIREPSNLILTNNATDSLNLALKGYLKEGDHVVTTNLEHNAVIRPLWALRKTRNLDVTVVNSNLEGEINPDDILKAVTPKTKLIACVHASNVLGTIQPIREIAQKTRELGIPLLVDGSQTTGALPVNIEELGIDMFAFTGHKSLLGLTGTGGLFVRENLDLQPLREGGNGTHSNSLEQPTVRPERYESGTPNMVGLAGLLAGVEYLLEHDVSQIRQHELELNTLLMARLSDIAGVRIYGPKADNKVGITSISLDNLDTAELGQMLGKKFGVMVRTGIHCSPLIHQTIGTKDQGTIRFSLGWANTREDIDTAVQAVSEIAQAIYRRV